MALTPRLDLRQSQALVMTPQLQQAIKMLQLNNLEIMAYVDEQLEQNPLLERDDTEEQSTATPEAEPLNGDAPPETVEAGPLEVAAPENPVEPLDSDYDNMWNADSGAEIAPPASMEMWRSTGGGTAAAIPACPRTRRTRRG